MAKRGRKLDIQAAKERIARALAEGTVELDLSRLDLTEIPDEIAGLTALQTLNLSGTKVADLAPIAGLTALQSLDLGYTQVADLAPIAGLTALQSLNLSGTQVTDLAPIAGLTVLQSLDLRGTLVADLRPVIAIAALTSPDDGEAFYAVDFSNCLAARIDPDIARIAAIEDDDQRAEALLAYLKTLPPWPEPLPWHPPADPDLSAPPEAPDAAPQPVLRLTEDHRIDLPPVPPGESELSDPIRERLYTRLPDAVETLLRFGNRYPDILTPARALKDLVAAPFPAADILSIHLEIAALTDVKEGQPARAEAERLDADCRAALDAVLWIGPPVTMGHPDIDLFESRSIDYARTRRLDTVAEGERRITAGIAGAEDVATAPLRRTAESLASITPGSRRDHGYRTRLGRNRLSLGRIHSRPRPDDRGRGQKPERLIGKGQWRG